MAKANWKKLEERVEKLLYIDKARRTPGSGNSKSEEDVVGISTICQCKDSDNKNITILTKDIERLLASAKLLNKTPLFASRAGAHFLISLVIDSDNIDTIQYVLDSLVIISRLKIAEEEIERAKTYQDIIKVSREVDKIVKAKTTSQVMFKERLEYIKTRLDVKIADATMNDLFEDQHVH